MRKQSKPKKWNSKEESYLVNNYQGLTYQEMANMLNRTKYSIMARCALLRLVGTKRKPPKIKEKFGRLTVISKLKKKGERYTIYLCICECGNEHEVAGYSLRSGSIKSCGCLNVDRTKETRRIDIGESSFHFLETNYKSGAKNKPTPVPYCLTFEQFKMLVTSNCHYCGAEPRKWNRYYKRDGERKGISTSDEWADQQWILINGIDRVDNSKGYIIENCVSCCSLCNAMKKDNTKDVFLDHVEKIASYQKNKNENNN
jgi:hypothetical protein